MNTDCEFPIMERIEHEGHVIEIVYDECAQDMNPLTEDYATGIGAIVNHGRDTTEYNGGIDVPTLTREQIKANARDLCTLLGFSSLLTMRREGYCESCDVVEVVNDAIADHLSHNLSNSELPEFFEELLPMAGIVCLNTSGHGYTQGDYHDIFLAMDPSVQSEYSDPHKTLQVIADEYSKWAYGDVHGWRVLKPKVCECCGTVENEIVESVWGYLARYNDETWKHMIEEAKAVIH